MAALGSQHSEPNKLEREILSRLLMDGDPIDAAALIVIGRELTGAGSYTIFATPGPAPATWRDHVGLDSLIEIPGVVDGLGAVLWLDGRVPVCLEIFTYGDSWDGSIEGFQFK